MRAIDNIQRAFCRVNKALYRQIATFGIVGIAGIFVNILVFNLLMLLGFRNIAYGSVLAASVAVIVSIFFNWIGNRHLVFRDLRRDGVLREAGRFFLVSIGGSLVQLACLVVSHYGMGFTSILADNIASSLVGLPLATVLRFIGYYFWVFSKRK